MMKNVLKMLFAVLAISLFLVAAPAFAAKANASQPVATVVVTDMVTLEAMWTAGGPEYRAAVNRAADAYMQKMNTRCQGFVDAGAAIKAYDVVYTPTVMEAARDQLVKKQVSVLACMAKYGRAE